MAMLWIALSIAVAAFYAAAETGAYRLNRIRLHGEAKRGRRTAKLTESVVADMERYVCTTLTAHNTAVYCGTVFFAALVSQLIAHDFARQHDLMVELISTVTLAPVMLIIGEVIPKSVAQVLADPLMRWSSPLLWLTNKLLWPVVTLLLGLVAFWRRLLGGRAEPRKTVVTAQYLGSLLSAGTQEGIITPQQDVIVRNILQLRGRPVREIMTPMSHVQMVPVDADPQQARTEIARFTHARLPVFEGDRSNVVGSLRVLDYLCGDEGGDIRKLLHPPLLLNAETGVDEAFRRLQETAQSMAVVVGARDRAVGVITMDDLLQGVFSTLGSF
jgi:CBS domain containing-hemolysin-like protein